MTAISDETLRIKCEQEPWVQQKKGAIKFGAVPEQFDKMAAMMPDGSAERQSFSEVAEKARDTYRAQAMALLDMPNLNETRVKALCAAEPWTSAKRMEDVLGSKFGYVIEKCKFARDLFKEDSDEYKTFDSALEVARIEYFAQMHDISRRYARGKSRAEVEAMNSALFTASHQKENNGTFVGNRLYTLCELNGEYYRMSGEVLPRASGVEQFVANGASIKTPKP